MWFCDWVTIGLISGKSELSRFKRVIYDCHQKQIAGLNLLIYYTIEPHDKIL